MVNVEPTHRKVQRRVAFGEPCAAGSRSLTIKAFDGDVLDCDVQLLKGESFELRDPKQKDAPWQADEDPGEGEMQVLSLSIKMGHKLRLGAYRQIRVIGQDAGSFVVNVIVPAAEAS